QAIYNVLDNALDFSPENSHIQIHISQQQHQARIRIQDQGTGIPDYALTKIFDKFYSLPRPQNAPNGGQKSTGLGLNFVQEVVKLHLGEIHIENNNASQGVTVSILLPLNI
ncbi:MAG: two-component system sensor histidine kinase CreC, partial [Methylotenera sp.]